MIFSVVRQLFRGPIYITPRAIFIKWTFPAIVYCIYHLATFIIYIISASFRLFDRATYLSQFWLFIQIIVSQAYSIDFTAHTTSVAGIFFVNKMHEAFFYNIKFCISFFHEIFKPFFSSMSESIRFHFQITFLSKYQLLNPTVIKSF